MDFGALLHMAKKNSENVKNSEGKFYSTKYSAPKKESKEKTLSDNIKKFLAKKELEEKEEARIKKEKVTQLLALRDDRSKNKIRKMLKVIKSANKSVLSDAVDNENTAVTLQGPDQPDDDDYGYVSQESAAFYQKYMEKVKAIPEEDKFSRSKSSNGFIKEKNINNTKNRVKEAIKKEEEEKLNPNRTKSKSTDGLPKQSSLDSFSTTSRNKKDSCNYQKDKEEQKQFEEENKKKFKKPAPPLMDFQELLKLAEKKQHEPVEIEVEIEKEPERLLTKKQKKELEERKAYLEERGRKERNNQGKNISLKHLSNKQQPLSNKPSKPNNTSNCVGNGNRKSLLPNDKIDKVSKQNSEFRNNDSKTKVPISELKSNKETIKTKNLSDSGTKNFNNKSSIKSSSNQPIKLLNNKSSTKSMSALKQTSSVEKLPKSLTVPTDINRKYSSDRNTKQISKSLPLSSSSSAGREKTRQFPPPDVHRKNLIKKPLKRQIIDDEDEYDSELDDFIDDEVGEEGNYSSYIKEIFGYDKSRYRDFDDDDANMESSFVQQMKEEQLSKKIGLMEDLEDMRLEAEEKKRKALIKKRKLK